MESMKSNQFETLALLFGLLVIGFPGLPGIVNTYLLALNSSTNLSYGRKFNFPCLIRWRSWSGVKF